MLQQTFTSALVYYSQDAPATWTVYLPTLWGLQSTQSRRLAAWLGINHDAAPPLHRGFVCGIVGSGAVYTRRPDESKPEEHYQVCMNHMWRGVCTPWCVPSSVWPELTEELLCLVCVSCVSPLLNPTSLPPPSPTTNSQATAATAVGLLNNGTYPNVGVAPFTLVKLEDISTQVVAGTNTYLTMKLTDSTGAKVEVDVVMYTSLSDPPTNTLTSVKVVSPPACRFHIIITSTTTKSAYPLTCMPSPTYLRGAMPALPAEAYKDHKAVGPHSWRHY